MNAYMHYLQQLRAIRHCPEVNTLPAPPELDPEVVDAMRRAFVTGFLLGRETVNRRAAEFRDSMMHFQHTDQQFQKP